MTIITKDFRKYGKVLLQQCGTESEYEQDIYFDFVEGWAYVQSKKSNVRLKLEYVLALNEVLHPNFYVNADFFISLCQYYDTLELANYTFPSINNDSFELKHIKEVDIAKADFNPNPESLQQLVYNEDFASVFVKSMNYIADSQNPAQMAVFFQSGNIITSDRRKIFIGKITSTYPDAAIMSQIAQVIAILEPPEDLVFGDMFSDHYYLQIGDILQIRIPHKINLKMADVSSAKFIATYNHASNFVVNKDALLDILSFLEHFNQTAPNQRAKFELAAGNKLSIHISDVNKITRHMNLISSVNVDGIIFWGSTTLIKMILSHIEDEEILVQVTEKHAAINFVGNTNKDINVIYSKVLQAEESEIKK